MSQKDLKKKLKSKHKKDENEAVVTAPSGGEHHQPADRAERHGKELENEAKRDLRETGYRQAMG